MWAEQERVRQSVSRGGCVTVSGMSLQPGDSSGPNFCPCSIPPSFACCPLELQALSLSLEQALPFPVSEPLLRLLFWPVMSVPGPQQLPQARVCQGRRHWSAQSFSRKVPVQMSLLGDFPVPQDWATPPSSPDKFRKRCHQIKFVGVLGQAPSKQSQRCNFSASLS